ncbi:adenosine deaminase [Boudabousia tangfeifanii]|uniref:Adenosine deaminase n=1 Tax=Boudabousia tangfeifanii TaxID=1912795 RepID=A0A1D9MJ35_9ACTO|nr:adenosine deaminase [Boudabousia tangfeifanii]AOZ72203.1 adenosine deaminase [Boudabousia tangfeifanii]
MGNNLNQQSGRDLSKLPKAHLHLHFTGSLRPQSLTDLAQAKQIRLPANLLDHHPLRLPADRRGWFRFQRAYDAARALVRDEETMRRIVKEAAEDDAAEGSKRLEIQVDPTSYAPFVGGITPALEIILDEAKQASARTGVEVAVIVAASRMQHPLNARTLARLARQYAGDQPGEVVGFGLSNDERNGNALDWEPAFRLARQAGLAALPHGGELRGPNGVKDVMKHLGPIRLGHGIRATEDPRLLEELVARDVAFEVCPASNVSLGVFSDAKQVPLRQLYDSDALISLNADDPLLFRSRLVDQYETARELGFSDEELAEIARRSIKSSLASDTSKRQWLAEVDQWLLTSPKDA